MKLSKKLLILTALCCQLAYVFWQSCRKSDKDIVQRNAFTNSNKNKPRSVELEKVILPIKKTKKENTFPFHKSFKETSDKNNTKNIFSWSFIKSKKVENLVTNLKDTKAIRVFKPRQNPVEPGCYVGNFLTKSNTSYAIRLFLSMETPDEFPPRPFENGWEIGTSSTLKIEAYDGERWTSTIKENEKFLLASPNLENGLFMEIANAFVLQLFPWHQGNNRSKGYAGFVYSKGTGSTNLIEVSEVKLTFDSGSECLHK